MELETFSELVCKVILKERMRQVIKQKNKLLKLSNSVGLAAMAISFPPLIYVIGFGQVSSQPSYILIVCIIVVFATAPLWFLADFLQQCGNKI